MSRQRRGNDARATGQDADATRAWIGVVRAYNLCDAALSARLAGVGLRVAEHELLVNLLRTPGMTQQALAQRCFVAKSGISMTLTRMEAQKLLRREPDAQDGRIRRLHLSKRGEALARRSLAVQEEVVGAMGAELTRDELRALEDMMRRMSARLETLLP
jgi:DNA-binding MarR family transcriptional regulator